MELCTGSGGLVGEARGSREKASLNQGDGHHGNFTSGLWFYGLGARSAVSAGIPRPRPLAALLAGGLGSATRPGRVL